MGNEKHKKLIRTILCYLALGAVGAGTCPIPTDGQANCGGASTASCSQVIVPFQPGHGSSVPQAGPFSCVQISTPNDRKPKTCGSSGGTVDCAPDNTANVVRHYDLYLPITRGTPPVCIDCDLTHVIGAVGENVSCPTASTVPNSEDKCKPPTDSGSKTNK
jgi:hypothetical protein